MKRTAIVIGAVMTVPQHPRDPAMREAVARLNAAGLAIDAEVDEGHFDACHINDLAEAFEWVASVYRRARASSTGPGGGDPAVL